MVRYRNIIQFFPHCFEIKNHFFLPFKTIRIELVIKKKKKRRKKRP